MITKTNLRAQGLLAISSLLFLLALYPANLFGEEKINRIEKAGGEEGRNKSSQGIQSAIERPLSYLSQLLRGYR